MTEKMTKGQTRVRQLRGMTGLTRLAFSEKHNIPIPSLRAWEISLDKISTKMVSRLVQAFQDENIDVSQEWLLFGRPPGPRFKEDGGKENNQCSPLTTEQVIEKDDFFITVDNNDHAPYISWGDKVGGDTLSPFDIPTDKSILGAFLINDTWTITNILRVDNNTVLSISCPKESSFLRKSTLIPIQAIVKFLKIQQIHKI